MSWRSAAKLLYHTHQELEYLIATEILVENQSRTPRPGTWVLLPVRISVASRFDRRRWAYNGVSACRFSRSFQVEGAGSHGPKINVDV